VLIVALQLPAFLRPLTYIFKGEDRIFGVLFRLHILPPHSAPAGKARPSPVRAHIFPLLAFPTGEKASLSPHILSPYFPLGHCQTEQGESAFSPPIDISPE